MSIVEEHSEEIKVNSICSRLTDTLEVETYDCMEAEKTGETIGVYEFKENCDWNVKDGYYCEVRELR